MRTKKKVHTSIRPKLRTDVKREFLFHFLHARFFGFWRIDCVFCSSLVIIVPSVSVKWNQCALYFAKMTTHEMNKSSNTEQKWFVKETTKAVTYKNGEKIHGFWTRRCAWAKGNKTESNPCNKLQWHKHTFKRRKKSYNPIVCHFGLFFSRCFCYLCHFAEQKTNTRLTERSKSHNYVCFFYLFLCFCLG